MSTAVIREGGRQYAVTAGNVIEIDRLGLEPGADLVFEDVLLVTGEAGTSVGHPRVDGAKVTATVVGECKGQKVITFKYRRRKHSTATRKGHRQRYTRVRITGVEGA